MISKIIMHNADLFTWTNVDMLGIDLKVITHKLLVYKEEQPISQKKEVR